MNKMPEKYLGDKNLKDLLEITNVTIGLQAVLDITVGAAAAPVGRNPDAWMELIAPDAGEELRGQLRALKADVGVNADSGLSASPAPRERIDAMRAELSRQSLGGFVVPKADEHQGEYVPARAERLQWLTGFRGSAGLAIVLTDKAAIFVDGRYTLQVQSEVDAEAFEVCHLSDTPPAKWIEENLPDGAQLGFDAWLHTDTAAVTYRKAAEKAGGGLVAVDSNPVDAVWAGQPAAPVSPIVAHGETFSGKPSVDKRTEIGGALVKDGVDAAVLTAPDSIAWLLNVRGGDVPHTPMPLSFAILENTGAVRWFVNPHKLAPGLAAHLGNGVAVEAVENFPDALAGLKGKTVLADPTVAAHAVFAALKAGGAEIRRADDPCALPKACKNDVEIQGTKSAHARDGKALTRFLSWFDSAANGGKITEIQAADQLQAFRYENELIQDLSFRTISGSGMNGAIVHYSVSAKTNRTIETGELYLVDSGAQYMDGTTDVTRTIAVGTPSDEMRDRFTRVLKGHIAIATARFPVGTTGSHLDSMARRPLWDAGLDFDHGTGHGVGSYLSVHEGPHRISKAANNVALRPGMIVSNEPGYYKTGAYGIRIENLVTVVPCSDLPDAERDMLCFETLTLAPIDLRLVEASLLNKDEVDWLNGYHARVREALSPQLDQETAAWLAAATRQI